ncbi:GNAT family N-acetyltransferase [Allobranchiibius sp. CTAmp26]|uniref:GNAT family N-acetyltransferase n=1 Tax=Allobranchiibius sp. CTAmp26 TaxID=2815214 RepID=UPI001AA16616|nr:GNAT family N-acetyltransferase [Allobranchiibius sp. CTAmp26]MBO1756561.1 GNAT family N-acetyltransferase [Allobranchiibius sp. CTAmp26]
MGTWFVTDTYDEAVLGGTLVLLSQEWWTRDRRARDVEASLRASQLVFTAADGEGQVVGTARVLTDFVYLATVLDVISSQAHRGKGIGAALMQAITEHSRLQHVDSIELVCQPELQDFYARWGFNTAVGRSGLMRRTSNPSLGATATR